MAFPDPLVVDYGGDDTSFARIDVSSGKSIYSNEDGSAVITTTQSSNGKRKRTSVRIQGKKFASDPFIPATNVELSESVTLVIDRPITGFSVADTKVDVDLFVDLLTRNSAALLTKLLGGES